MLMMGKVGFQFRLSLCIVVCTLELSAAVAAGAGTAETRPAIIPRPALAIRPGGHFEIGSDTGIRIAPDDPDIRAIGEYLAECLRQVTGKTPAV